MNANQIKELALSKGFDFCGIASAEEIVPHNFYLKNWLESKHHGNMNYMENHFSKRTDPTLLFENAKSVISCLFNYFPEKSLPEESYYRISNYAYGNDYHFILKKRLNDMIHAISNAYPDSGSRAFVDSAPVLEKAWAEKAGIGFIGKNTCLINKKKGSYFFIGEIITTVFFEYDPPEVNRCGNCTRCIDACPTGAIVAPFQLDARKCISYLTIENKEAIPDHFKNSFHNYIYGCDICQQVCPWNRFAQQHNEPDLNPGKNLKEMTREKWDNLKNDHFNTLFKQSAIKRTGYQLLVRNIDFVNDTN